MDPRLELWAANQRALARALGLSIAEWLECLDAAAERRTGLMAAAVGASMAAGFGLGALDALDGPALAASARRLIDPAPPRAEDPIIAEAIRRADELPEGRGAARLGKKAEARNENAPRRSASAATADAPGEDP